MNILHDSYYEVRLKEATVHSIEEAWQNKRKIEAWIENIEKVHRQKPPPSVDYSNPMPQMEELMKVLPLTFQKKKFSKMRFGLRKWNGFWN